MKISTKNLYNKTTKDNQNFNAFNSSYSKQTPQTKSPEENIDLGKNKFKFDSYGSSSKKEKESNMNTIKQETYDKYFNEEEIEYYKKLYSKTKIESSVQINFDTYIKKGELIGEGGYGKVYLGFDERTGGVLAIKEIKITKDTKDHMDNVCFLIQKIEAIRSEIEIMGKLHHSNIVKYYGLIKNDLKLGIVLEYCIGGSLAKIIKTFGKFNEKLIKKYLRQILEGLEYLHSHNIIHRGNFLL